MRSNNFAMERVFKDILKATDLASVDAINRAAKSTMKMILTELVETYKISQKKVKDYYRFSKATKEKPFARISGNNQGIPVFEFGAKTKYKSNRGSKKPIGVQAEVKKGNKVLYESSSGNKAFISSMNTGHKGVFVRKRKGRLPVQELYGMNPVKIMLSDSMFEKIQKHYIDRYQVEFERQLKYRLN